MTNTLFAIDDGLINGNLDVGDVLFLVAALLFLGVTFLHAKARAVEAALTTAAFCLLAVAFLIL